MYWHFTSFFEAGLKVLTKLFDGSGIVISDITKNANILITDFDVSWNFRLQAKTRWLYNTVAMEMFVVFNIPPFCSLDSFASHLFRVFVHLNTIKKQGFSRDLRSLSAIFCLVFSFFLRGVFNEKWQIPDFLRCSFHIWCFTTFYHLSSLIDDLKICFDKVTGRF